MAGNSSLFGKFSRNFSCKQMAILVAGSCFIVMQSAASAQAGIQAGGKSSNAQVNSATTDPNKAQGASSANADEATSSWSSTQAKTESAETGDDRTKAKPKNVKKISAIAPLCSIDSFARSALVQNGAWPNVGPFKMSEEGASQLVDDAHNSIKLKANSQQKITGVEMLMTGRPSRDFLSVEMATDFLLEALGSKPGRVSDLNTKLESMKSKLLKQGTGEENLNAGRYLICIKPAGRTGLNISVNSADASAEAIKDHTQNTTDLGPMDNTEDGNNTETKKRLMAMIHTKSPENTRSSDNQQPAKPAKRAPANKEAATDASDPQSPNDLKETFSALIQNWQQIKKVAVKTRETKELSKVLAGNALVKQTKGVKWLADGHKYYDMQPLSVEILRCTEVTKGSKYIVTARVKEYSKFYDEGQSTPLRTSEDSYSVNYTVDKMGNHFVISDSAMVELSAPLSPKINAH